MAGPLAGGAAAEDTGGAAPLPPGVGADGARLRQSYENDQAKILGALQPVVGQVTNIHTYEDPCCEFLSQSLSNPCC